MGRNAVRSLILAAAVLVCTVKAVPCAAQAPESEKPTAVAARTAALPPPGEQAVLPGTAAAPLITPFAGQGKPPLSLSLPSSVSSDIERFVNQRGGNSPTSPTPSTGATMRAREGRSTAPLPPLPAPLGRTPGTFPARVAGPVR
ncbi:MAG: hypothetical protein ACP5XB_08985, partial [Isosphaeraceae bacterium]